MLAQTSEESCGSRCCSFEKLCWCLSVTENLQIPRDGQALCRVINQKLTNVTVALYLRMYTHDTHYKYTSTRLDTHLAVSTKLIKPSNKTVSDSNIASECDSDTCLVRLDVRINFLQSLFLTRDTDENLAFPLFSLITVFRSYVQITNATVSYIGFIFVAGRMC